MNRFFVNKEPNKEDRYYISVTIVIYRALHKKYPDFLQWCETPKNAKEGYPTKFCYCTEHTMLSKTEASTMAEKLENEYAPKLRACEESGDWSQSPYDFTKMQLLYSK